MNTGFIGIGSMGGMLLRSILRSCAIAPATTYAANRSPIQIPGIHVMASAELTACCDLIFLCVHATEIPAVLSDIASSLTAEKLLVTTSATISLQKLEDQVPCRVAKLIPSITQEIGAGITLLMYGSRMTPGDRTLLEELLNRISQPIVIPESLARPSIGLTSGGPALIAYLLQSMAEEAVRSNPELSPELARHMVYETATATLRLLLEANLSPEEIIHRVAVPGGMTALSLEVLARHVPQAWQTVFRETAQRQAKMDL
ncbi:MAG TPA: pyrroline-5-carboxylate reductase dimerization domain-containing protein [Bryobacteraceae bacterium]|nr:pyrroline-5-carboxylate reductase dimerization domain-containing protein [Bryobacteraceae bacterium]